MRRGDRPLRLGGAELRHRAERLAGRGVADLVLAALVGIAPFAVDIALLAEQRGILEFQSHVLTHP